jgi:hypothetical protein
MGRLLTPADRRGLTPLFWSHSHEVAVTTTARRLAQCEVKMQEAIDAMDVRDRIHTMAVYRLALQLAVFSRKGVQRSRDQAAQTTETIGRPRPYSVARCGGSSREKFFAARPSSPGSPRGPLRGPAPSVRAGDAVHQQVEQPLSLHALVDSPGHEGDARQGHEDVG